MQVGIKFAKLAMLGPGGVLQQVTGIEHMQVPCSNSANYLFLI